MLQSKSLSEDFRCHSNIVKDNDNKCSEIKPGTLREHYGDSPPLSKMLGCLGRTCFQCND